nr:MAG: RNA-dependent RNA polymerase [Streptophyte partitivirus]
MGSLRFLRKVSRFSSKSDQYHDPYALEALNSVSGPKTRAFISEIRESWHRPSGDNATLENNLMNYDIPSPKRCYDGDYLAILKKTLDELRPVNRIIPLTLGAAATHHDMPRTTSAGFPWKDQGYRNKGEIFDDPIAMGKIRRAWDSIGRGIPWSLPDSLAFHRTIASTKDKSKIRPIWGYPTDVIVEEARFFMPLMSALKVHCNETDSYYGLGMETALSGHSHLARNFATLVVEQCLCADLSAFDSRVPDWIIRDVFSFMSDWFDFSKVIDSDGKVWDVNPDQTCRRWKAMVSYFVNTKIRTPTGLRVQKNHGVPSGSMFTNLIDTIVNAVQMRTALRRVTGELPTKDYYYGDDSCIFLSDGVDIEQLAAVLLSVFGAVLSVEKTVLTDNPENIHWLGYYHRVTGPRRSLDFIVASTLFPEREVLSPMESCARLLGQLYSSMDPVCSVVFYDAVKYLQSKYSITNVLLESFVSSLSSKAMKYLITLGLTVTDIVVPGCFVDPFGDRYIPDVLPRPSSRKFTSSRDHNLPEFAFVPEAYSNRYLRTRVFTDFHHYIKTFTFYDEFDLDSAYFTE